MINFIYVILICPTNRDISNVTRVFLCRLWEIVHGGLNAFCGLFFVSPNFICFSQKTLSFTTAYACTCIFCPYIT